MAEDNITDLEESKLKEVNLKEPVDILHLNEKITTFLDELKLPSQDLFAPIEERKKVFNNFPDVAVDINPEIRRQSYYISKFFAAATVGLFDASLNYLWDAIIENLRFKVIKFDVSYFFDSHPVAHISRNTNKDEEELNKLSDQDLLEGCLAIGIVESPLFQEIKLIQYMRNHASAAHPNINEIKGLSLISWLDSCNSGLFEKEFPTSAIVAHKFIKQIKNNTILSEENIKYANRSLESLKTKQIDALLSAIIGLYLDISSQPHVKNNVFQFANTLWNLSSENPKNQLGMKYAHFSANQVGEKTKLIKDFLEKVNGLSYLPEDVRIIELENLLENLRNTHHATYNFYNEPPIAKEVRKYISQTGKIPNIIRSNYVKVIITCRLGNSYGVSREACPYYDEMIDLFQRQEIVEFCKLLLDEDILSDIGPYSIRRKNVFVDIAEKLKGRSSGQLEEFLNEIVEKKNQFINLIHLKT